jgi:hypothetical protein
MLYRDVNGNVTSVEPGNDGDVLTLVAGVPDWSSSSLSDKASVWADALDAVFKKIVFAGPVSVDNPKNRVTGTHALLGYAAATREGIAWQRYMPESYDGGDLKATIMWVPTSTTPGEVVEWGIALERDFTGLDLTPVSTEDAFGALTLTGVQAATTEDTIAVYSTATITGAALESLAGGEAFRLYVERAAGAGLDTYTEEAQLLRVSLEEV